MRIKRTSTLTGLEHELDIAVTQAQLDSWIAGTLIQKAMPNIPKELREFIISGITPQEWEAHFGGEDE